jgi:nucleotide-binding universal stress UspA family protein
MPTDDRPIVVAYDGSEQARAAVAAAAELFGGRRLVVVSVWEPGAALAYQTTADPLGMSPPPPSPEQIVTLDRLEHDHARSLAEAGARLARDRGATAVADAVEDGVDVADTILAAAARHDAAAVVVGSRGLGAVKSRLFGSTSRGLLHEARLPVMVVRAGE